MLRSIVYLSLHGKTVNTYVIAIYKYALGLGDVFRCKIFLKEHGGCRSGAANDCGGGF